MTLQQCYKFLTGNCQSRTPKVTKFYKSVFFEKKSDMFDVDFCFVKQIKPNDECRNTLLVVCQHRTHLVLLS